MSFESTNEELWKNVKFLLIFLFSVLLLFTLQTKFLIKVPVSNNELLQVIDDSEVILEKQTEYAKKIQLIHQEIVAMEFDIHQVQKQDEVSKSINQVSRVFTTNGNNSKYSFGLFSSKILQMFFDSRQEESSLKKNIEIIKKNLTECKANI